MKIRFAVAPDTRPASGDTLVAFAEAVERNGFDGVWLSDLPLSPTIDPLLGLALIAGRTSRLLLGANVVPLGHNPFLLAKQLAQLDQVSGGRLLLSFVTGIGRAGERAALGLGDATRGEVLEQVLELVREWWAGGEPATRPVQQPLEVWLGGRVPEALERAGRIADGWLGAMVTPPEAGAAREQIQAAAAAAGREFDPEHFGLSVAYARETPSDRYLAAMRARRADVDPLAYTPVGRDALRELIERYVEAGLSKFVVRPVGAVASWDDEAEWLADAILAMQTA